MVLAHLEPELELFEVDDVGDDGGDDLWQNENIFRIPWPDPSEQLRKVEKNQTVKSQQSSKTNKKKTPHYDHFPRPRDIDPYIHIKVNKK